MAKVDLKARLPETDVAAVNPTFPNPDDSNAPSRPSSPHPPPRDPTPDAQDGPRRLTARTLDDKLALSGSLVGSLALVWLIYLQILPVSGLLGFLICWYVVFLALYARVTSQSQPRPIVIDRMMSAVMYGAAGIVGFALLTTVLYVFIKGWPALHHVNFLTKDMSGVRTTDPLDKGGILHAIVGSGIELGIATLVSLPLGVATAVYMTEVGGRLARIVRTVIESMTALPDLLAGLFIYTVLILALGFERSGLCAAMALSVMMLPIIARSADVVLRVVPGGLREAGLALGASQWQTVVKVVLPTARPGLATALILGLARAVGETAPVLITSGASTFLNLSPTKDPMNSLPLFVYQGVRSGEPTYIARAFGAASVLLILIGLLFTITRLIARQPSSR